MKGHRESRVQGNEGTRVVFTTDVEYTPPWKSGSWLGQSQDPSLSHGLRNLLELLLSKGVKGTFLVEGIVARDRPTVINEIRAMGHEIGYHGWAHESYGGLWRASTIVQPAVLNVQQVGDRLRAGKRVIKAIVGENPTSFVAPFHHVRRSTLRMLADEGFTADSSIYNHVYGYTEPAALRFSSGSLVEIPFAVPLHPEWRFFSPFFPTLLDAVVHDGSAFENNPDRLMCAGPEGDFTYLLLTCHPWEFIDTHDTRFLALKKLLEYLGSGKESEFVTMKEVAKSLGRV